MPFSLHSYGKKPTCTTVVQDIASVYHPHSGLLPSHTHKKHRLQHSFARLYDFINLVCQKRGAYAYTAWERLISEDSIIKERFQIGAIRPIRVDHTDFSKWLLKLIHFMNLNSQWST
jgi:hypothetical protein